MSARGQVRQQYLSPGATPLTLAGWTPEDSLPQRNVYCQEYLISLSTMVQNKGVRACCPGEAMGRLSMLSRTRCPAPAPSLARCCMRSEKRTSHRGLRMLNTPQAWKCVLESPSPTCGGHKIHLFPCSYLTWQWALGPMQRLVPLKIPGVLPWGCLDMLIGI